MKRILDLGYLNDVLVEYYASKADMAKQLGISRSHIQEVFKNTGIGEKVLAGLKSQAEEKGFSYELCLLPEPIFMDGVQFGSIDVVDENGELLASITSRDVIEREGTKVIMVPVKF